MNNQSDTLDLRGYPIDWLLNTLERVKQTKVQILLSSQQWKELYTRGHWATKNDTSLSN